MLRKRLLIRVGLLVIAFVVGAIVAVTMLQGVIRDVDRVNADAAMLTGGVQELSAAITSIEAAKFAAGEEGVARADLESNLAEVRAALEKIGEHPIMRAPDGHAADEYAALVVRATALSAGAERLPAGDFAMAALSLREQVREIGIMAAEQIAAERSHLAGRIRLLVLLLTIAALIMVNVSVIVLLRTLFMILRPVDELVRASRMLAHERFDHRVEIDSNDEFGELAHAYNRLAEQLAVNEARKMETLRQVAVTLNHDLNNAISVIEMQLRLLDPRDGKDPNLQRRLGNIHESLARMAHTIRSLTRVRRIVLTEYLPGEYMLDIERSAAETPPSSPAPPSPPAAPAPKPTVAKARGVQTTA